MNKKIIYSMLLFVSLSYGIQPDSQSNEFGPSQDDNSFVGDSDMTKDDYTKGTHYNVNLGPKTKTRVVDPETGTVKIVDANGKLITSGNDNNLSEGYRKSIHDAMWKTGLDGEKEFVGGLSESSPAFKALSDAQKEALRKAKKDAVDAAKLERDKELNRKGHNQTNRESLFLKGLSSNGKGEGITSRFRKGKNHIERDENGKAYMDDTNSTKFYNDNFSYHPDSNSNLRLTESKVEALKKAYDNVEAMKELMRSQTDSNTIQCFISRDLIEAYYCPMSDRNDILFPDFLNGGATIDEATHYSSSDALTKCQNSCSKPQGCRGLTVQNATYKKFNFNKEIYPNMTQTNGEFILNVSDIVQSEVLSFDLVVEGADSFDGNIEKLDKYLQDYNEDLKVKYTVINKESTGKIVPEAITLLSTQKINKSTIRVFVSLRRQSDRFILKMFKPFMYPVSVPQNQRTSEAEFFSKIKKVYIRNIKIDYTGNEVYFCPSRQIITNSTQCASSKVLHINQNGQIFDVCLDNEHKIGDDMHTGGFFDEESCVTNCRFRKDCQTTYKHYSELTKKKIYKTTIGCVNSDENMGCQDEYCETLFADPEVQPVSELTINSKDERVYTVKNFLSTNVKRPKIDLVGEQSAIEEEDYDTVFQREMKDAAYENMIKKQTFNRLRYKIGEFSPEQYAHFREQTELGNQFKGLIKYRQDKYDDDKFYNVYSVVELDAQYRLRYGQFVIPNKRGTGSKILNAEKESIMLLEKTYLIRKSNGDWKVFKKIFRDKIQKERKYKYCPDGSDFRAEESFTGELTVQDSNRHCYMQSEITWEALSDYRKEAFVKYQNGELKKFSKGETAEKFERAKVDSSTEIKEYFLTDSMERMLNAGEGMFIRDQITEDDGLSAKEIYAQSTPYNVYNRSQIFNYKIYLFTSERDISYENIMEFKLNEKTMIFDSLNRNLSRTKIEHDGTIKNGIKAYVMGVPKKTSIILDLKPKFEEEGKKAFQFMFLYNERLTSQIDEDEEE